MIFTDNHSDLNTVNYMAKSMESEDLSKALDKAGLVQKEVVVQGKHGTYTQKKWVKATEETAVEQPKQPKKEKRPQKPATPVKLTENTSYLVPMKSLDELPDHLKGKIMPNWREVVISEDPSKDILAIAKDDQNRPQYVYSQEHWDKADAEKFNRVMEWLKPEKQQEIQDYIEELDKKDKDTADCLKLILETGIRPGSTADTGAEKQAYGATTLKGRHVVIKNNDVYLEFTGKKGVFQSHKVPSDDLAAMLIRRKENVGDDGDLFNTTAADCRNAMKPLGLKTKDLRTLLANKIATQELRRTNSTAEPKEFEKIRNHVGDVVCSVLGNQRTMSLKSYINPQVFKDWSPEGHTNYTKYLEDKKAKKKGANKS